MPTHNTFAVCDTTIHSKRLSYLSWSLENYFTNVITFCLKQGGRRAQRPRQEEGIPEAAAATGACGGAPERQELTMVMTNTSESPMSSQS